MQKNLSILKVRYKTAGKEKMQTFYPQEPEIYGRAVQPFISGNTALSLSSPS